MKREGLHPFWVLIAGFALLTAAQSLRFLSGNPDDLHPIFRGKYFEHWPVVFAHGAAAITALAIGPFQFLPGLRRRFRRLHRVAGSVYFLGILVGGVTGFRMGMMAYGGVSPQLAFCLIAAAWIATGAAALGFAIRRDFAAHERWVIRNYALTFGAVMLRAELVALQLVGFDFEAVYPFVPWTAWGPCVLAAEWMILRNGAAWRALGAAGGLRRAPRWNRVGS